MRFAYLLFCWIPFCAYADIYKAVDADGHVTYSNAPIKGGKRISLTPTSEIARDKYNGTPKDFPKVSGEAQKERDTARKKILEDELKAEEGLLDIARQSLKTGQAEHPKDQDSIKDLNKQVDLHEGNVEALKEELSKLK
jgi:hypothetical protein